MAMRKFSWLVTEGCLAWLFVRFGSTACLILAAALILIPLASIPIHLHIRKNLTLRLESDPNLRKGEQGTICLKITKKTAIPIWIVCDIQIQNLLNEQSQRLRLALSGTRDGHSVRVSVGSAYAGRLRIRLQRFRLYDCFGLIGVPVKSGEACHVTVQPECFESRITLLPSVNAAEESEFYSLERPGWDLTEPWQLREYIPGDSPRQIHWKLSGKLDRLIVREPGLPVSQNVLVFWERTGPADGPKAMDAQAEAVVSVCRALLDQSLQFRLGWNDAKENRCIIHSICEMDDLIGVLPRLLSAAPVREGPSGAALLIQTHPDALCGHMVYIARISAPEAEQWRYHGHLTVLTMDKEALAGAIAFDETNYPTQLAALEL